jgi:hypothetical protein
MSRTSVIAGHSASKTRVNALMARQSILFARRWIPETTGVPADFVGGVPRPGHDGVKGTAT